MTDPNSASDLTLAAREIVKGWLPSSFIKAIDAGELDPWGLMDRAKTIVLAKPVIAEVEE
jgi:hypothetical protein